MPLITFRSLLPAMAALAACPALALADGRPSPADVGALPGGSGFVIQSCGESQSVEGWVLVQASDPASYDAGSQCPAVVGRFPSLPTSLDQTGIWLSDRLDATGGHALTAEGDRSEMVFTSAPGTAVTRLRYWRKVFKTAEDNLEPYVAVADRDNVIDHCALNGAPACQQGGDDWFPHDTNDSVERDAYRELDGFNGRDVILGIVCRVNDDHVCGNGFSFINAEVELFSAFITIEDLGSPLIGAPSGDAWTTEDWIQGATAVGVASSDVTGIAATRVYVDGSLVAVKQRACSYDRPRPCTDEPGATVVVPTAELADGQHALAVGVVDAAGNETRTTRPTPIKIDNNAPEAPVGLASLGAATSNTNNFSAHWSLPADSGAPIVSARYQVCQSGICGPTQAAPSLTQVDGLQLPAVGEGFVRVWLADSLGHEAPASKAAVLPLTYAPVSTDPGPVPVPTPTPDPTPDPVPTPTSPRPPAAKTSPALKLTSIRVAPKTHTILIRGSVSTKASGRVTVRFKARGKDGRSRTLTSHPRIRARRFATTLTLPRSLTRARAGTVTASYAGDADTRAQSRRATVRWRA